MIRHYVKCGHIAPVERIGNTMMFRRDEVEELAGRIERRWRVLPRDPAAAASPAPLLGAVALSHGQAIGVVVALCMMVVGLHGVVQERRRWVAEQPPLPTGERQRQAIATADIGHDPDRGYLFLALGGEFWRSTYGQWLFDDGIRTVEVDAPEALAALEERSAVLVAGWSL